jgi:hypothetical protein
MRILTFLVAALVPNAAPVDRQPIAIHPGETITLEVRDQTAVVVERGPAAPLTPFESAMIRRFQGVEIPAGSGVQPAIEVTRNDVDGEPPKPVPGRVRLSFRLVPGPRQGSEPHSVLILQNGYGNSFRYRVLMHSNGHVQPTDVCEVFPRISATEHWPYRIDQLDVTAAWLEPPQGGNARCE